MSMLHMMNSKDANTHSTTIQSEEEKQKYMKNPKIDCMNQRVCIFSIHLNWLSEIETSHFQVHIHIQSKKEAKGNVRYVCDTSIWDFYVTECANTYIPPATLSNYTLFLFFSACNKHKTHGIQLHSAHTTPSVCVWLVQKKKPQLRKLAAPTWNR